VSVGPPASANAWDIAVPKEGTRAFVVSEVIRAQSARLGEALPPLGSMNLVYDNGVSQVLRMRPTGAFERDAGR
jgi:hypothetical protein